jgi:high affinity sulfate transporter 1
MAEVGVVPEKTSSDRRLWSIAPPAWLSGYRRRWLVADALAGLTLWALLVPEAIAYASVAGIPAQFGLYSVPLALLAYAWFGSSQRLVMAPTSTIAALTATVIAPFAAAATDSYVLLTAVLSLLVGAIYLLLAAFKLGFISRVFARPVLDGFIVGLGVYIAVGQLPKLVGVEKPEGNTLRQLVGWVQELSDWRWVTLLIGVGSFLTLLLLEHVAPKVPAPIVVVVVSVALVGGLDLEDQGVEVVGDIPQGFAMLSWTGVSLSDVWALLPGALGIVVVGFAQSLAIAKAYAATDNTKVDADRELMAYGVSALGAGVLQGMPPSGSLSKSAATQKAGARTAMAFVVAVALVVLTILFLTGLFVNLPEAALAAIVIHAVMGMIKPLKIWGLRQVQVPDFWLALLAFLGVILIGVMAGIVIGVVLSLLLLLLRLGTPHTAVLGRDPGRGFVDMSRNPAAVPVPGVLVLRVDGPLVFASVDGALDNLRTALDAASEPPGVVVLDLSATYEIDVTAADALSALVDDLRLDGSELRFAGARAPVREYAARLGIANLAGLAEPYPTVADSVADLESR